MKVLVTGAAGYIGRYVVDELLNQGHKVLASDINSSQINPRAQAVDVPIFNDNEDIYAAVGKPDICIHLAWRNGFNHAATTHIVDLGSHFNFLVHMINGGLKHLSIMGSMHEVGYWVGSVDENTPCNPLSLYGIAKNALRQAIMNYANSKDICLQWLRAYYIFGDDMNNHSIFTKLLQAVQEGKGEFPFNSGTNKYDFINIFELAKQIVAVSTQTEIAGIINVCSGRPVSLGEKVTEFIKAYNLDIRLRYGAFPDRPYDSPAIWGDNTLITQILKAAE